LARSSYDQVWNCARAVERGARPQWRVPTGRARDHVLALRAAGLSVEEIARRAQLGSATVWRLLREDRAYNTTVAALLRVRA
jgi:DNA invertase Pin-like site-specific DNA recombinase